MTLDYLLPPACHTVSVIKLLATESVLVEIISLKPGSQFAFNLHAQFMVLRVLTGWVSLTWYRRRNLNEYGEGNVIADRLTVREANQLTN